MTTSVPDQFAQFVKQEVAAGNYRSEVEVVTAALELLQRRKQGIDALRGELQPSIDELDRGGGIIVDRNSLRNFLEGIAHESSTAHGLGKVQDS